MSVASEVGAGFMAGKYRTSIETSDYLRHSQHVLGLATLSHTDRQIQPSVLIEKRDFKRQPSAVTSH